ncbi:MAG: flagellar filament capping protein FliD [Pirellulales bacterium]
MGRITSSIGLVTGVPIAETVEKLVALQTGPRDQLAATVKKTQERQSAIVDLTARLIALQFTGSALGQLATFDSVTAASSDTNTLGVTAGASAAVGTHQITVLRKAQSQQSISSGFASRTSPVGAGTLAFRFGGAVNPDTLLAVLNGGTGVPRGSIRITDRSGATAEIDLRYARTVDDVLSAINGNSAIRVTAEVDGDALRLIDRSGGTASNLRVDEVGVGGKTAAALGLADIDVAAASARGNDVVFLGRGVQLANLNDGLGVRISDTLPDLRVSLRDGSTLDIDLRRAATGDGFATTTTAATNGPDARLTVTAVEKGTAYDGVKIVFVDDPAVTVGNETAVYDDSDPENKTITFHIDAGNTTAGDLVTAASASLSGKFTLAVDESGDGTGVVEESDSGVTAGGAPQDAANELSLGELIDTINAVDPTKLRIEIAPDGDRLQLVDLTADEGHDFQIEGLFGSQLAHDLGLDGEVDGDTIVGGRILAGLNTVLLKSLDGGKGLAPLGALSITDRSGAAASIDLSQAETLHDVISAINAAGIGVQAQVNDARNGLSILDTSGGAGNLLVGNGDEFTATAEKLQLVTDAARSRAESGNLRLQTVGENTTLTSLNGGNGIAVGRIRLYDSLGGTNSLNLSSDSIKTIGDVVDAINALAVKVTARINDDGDGILLIDEAGGPNQIRGEDLTGHAARDLGLLGTGTTVEIDGESRSVINGSSTIRVEIAAGDTLDDLVAKINQRDGGVTAGVLSDGAVFRLSLASGRSGDVGNVLFDTSGLSFSIEETARGRDALVLYGVGENTASSVLASSRTNRFESLIGGLTLDIKGVSTSAVTVSVGRSDTQSVTRAKAFVEAYNALQEKLKGYTSFDQDTFKTGVLFGSGETLRIQADLSRVLSGRVFGAGQFTSLKQLGIDLDQDGKLNFDETRFTAALSQDRTAVKQFFTSEKTSITKRLSDAVESLAGRDRSLLVSRAQALETRVQSDNLRVEFLSDRLDKVREKLLLQFYRMESTIGKLQASLTAIEQIQGIAPLSFRSGS